MGEENHVWKAWKKVKVSKEEYLVVKRGSKYAMLQKKLQRKRSFSASVCYNRIFRIAKQKKKSNQDVSGESYILYDNGNLTFSTAAKRNALKEHHNCLLNQNFV